MGNSVYNKGLSLKKLWQWSWKSGIMLDILQKNSYKRDASVKSFVRTYFSLKNTHRVLFLFLIVKIDF